MTQDNTFGKLKIAAILTVVVLFVGAMLFHGAIGIVKIEGDEIGVIQDWKQGVLNQTLPAGTHFYNNVSWDVHVFKIGTQKITFDSKDSNPDAEYDRIPVEIGENGGQRAWIALSLNYHINPQDIVALYKQGIAHNYENVVLKREIVDVVNEIARPEKALDIYSGLGFVKFKTAIEDALKNDATLKDRGIDVENTIIYNVHLDKAYEAEIAAKQLAMQQVLRKIEETKASEQEAKRIFAFGQATVEKARQDAEAQKITATLAAEGEGAKLKAIAEGQRDANLAAASGIKAIGEAEAAVAKLKTDAQYAGESGARRAQVEVAIKQAEIAKELMNRLTVLPEKSFVSLSKGAGVIPTADLTADNK